MDHSCTLDTPSRPPRARAVRAGPLLRVLLALVLAFALAACQTAEQDPGAGDAPPGTEQPGQPAPDEPDDGGADPDGTPEPDLDAVAIRLQTVHAADPTSETTAFEQPLGVVTDGATDLLYVMEKGGTVERVDEGTILGERFLDVHDLLDEGEILFVGGESGLLGLTFHPDYDPADETNRSVFVHYTPAADTDGNGLRTVVSRVRVDENGLAVPESETELFTVDQPTGMHNGGQLAFGPDGMLYVALGEGDADAVPSLSRDPGNPHGAILRIDPEAEADSFVAEGNPFAGATGGSPYVWHYGLRNPWRFSFDARTGDMWIADVGENEFEEINYVPAGTEGGLNFGWDLREGPTCITLQEECDEVDTTPPLYVYEHPDVDEDGDGEPDEGRSITGGYVYYGDAVSDLAGAYVFADFISGEVWALATVDDGEPVVRSLLDTDHMISSLGVDADGELLVVDYLGGLYRIVPDAAE